MATKQQRAMSRRSHVDPLWRACVTAPPDDEPYTLDQQARDAEAQAAIERGEGIPHQAVLEDLGIAVQF